MLFTALFNAVCLYSASLPLSFVFMLFLGLLTRSFLFQLLFRIMHSAFNMKVFILLCSHRFVCERAMCSQEK